MVVWTGGLTAAAVCAYTARRRAVALLPLVAAAAAGTLLVQTGEGLWHTDPLARRQVCDASTTPQICVNARYKDLLPQVTEALSGVTGRLEGVENLPARFEDLPGRPGADEVELPMITPIGRSVVRGRLTDPEEYAWAAGMALQDRGDCAEVAPRVGTVDDAVEYYLAPSPLRRQFDEQYARGSAAERAGLGERLAARERLASMGAEERRAWLSAYFAARGECGRGCRPCDARFPAVRPRADGSAHRARARRDRRPRRPGGPEPGRVSGPLPAGSGRRAGAAVRGGGDRHESAQRVRGAGPRRRTSLVAASAGPSAGADRLRRAAAGGGRARPSSPFGPSAMIRNTLGCAGLAAGAVAVLGARLSWLPVFAYVSAVYMGSVSARGTLVPVWAWPVRPAGEQAAWVTAVVLLVAGTALYTVRGARPEGWRG
ncbi:hypothetical protein SHKM778_79720 [Streptomyces sp. KM77-8]|uniref:Uncharacterized protein n=1 Tax=Streptomyces haneummycinicus TaxID=3074435 RepID=A0AAT9HW28_9ACTN